MHGVIYIIGDKGSGKSTMAVGLAKIEYDAGSKVVSNFALNFNHIYMTIKDMAELPDELINAVIIIDEAHMGANARTPFNKDNQQLISLVSQLRKMQSKILLISQKYKKVDKQIREDADYVITMFKYDIYSDDNEWFKYIIWDQKNTTNSVFGQELKRGWMYGPPIFPLFDTRTRIHADKTVSTQTKKQ